MGFELPIADVLIQFTVVVAAALAVQFAFEHSRVPGIVGLLLVGMLLGPGGAAVLPKEPVVELFGSIGLLYIMFLAGLEIDLDMVRRRKRESLAFGGLSFALSLVPAVLAGLWLGMGWAGALLLGAAISSHTLVAYPIIRRLGLIGQPAMVATIGGTLLTDTLALVLLAIVIQLPGEGGMLGWATPLLLLALLAAVALLAVPRLARALLADPRVTPAEQALLVLSLLLLLSVAAEVSGTKDILGAFLAGVCLNRTIKERDALRHHVEFVGRMLFVPFFFVDTGMRLEFEVFTGQPRMWLVAAVLLLIVLAGKAAAAWLAGGIFGYARAEQVTMWGLSIPQAAATLAVMVTGREAGLIERGIIDATIIVIFITCLAGPVVTRIAGSWTSRRLAHRSQLR